MRLSLTWPNLYPLWIETRGGKFFTTSYDDDGSLSWAYVVAQYTGGLWRRDNIVSRLYPFWDSAPRCKDRILGIWDNYHEAKEYLLTTDDELCYLAGCWVLFDIQPDLLPHQAQRQPRIVEGRPEGL